MKKLLFLFPILFLTILLTSCSAASKSIPDNLYSEEKIKQARELLSGKYGELLDSYTVAGDTYSLYCSRQNENNTYTVTKCTLNSDNEQLLPLALEESVNYLFICADAKGDILLSDTTTVYVFQSGETLSSLSLPTWSAGGMLITSDNLLVCQTFNNSAYFLFNLSTGDKQGTFLDTDFLFEQGTCQPFLCETDGEQFLLTSAGIYEYTENAWELCVPSSGTSLSKPLFLANNIEKGEHDTWIVCDSDYQYIYSPKEAADEEQITLRVTAWQDRYTLKAALTEYQIANPNVTIEYTYRCTDLPETAQEANTLIQQTNTELVSSHAADLYILNNLPWEQYREKGFLMDLSDIVQPFAEDEDYFGNILTAYQTEDGLFAVPWFFTVKFVVCREELVPYVQSIYSLAGYLEAHPEDSGIIPYYYRDNPELFFAMMYDFYADDLYEDGIVTLENVSHFLESAKIIYDRQQANFDATILPDYQTYYNYSYLQQYPCGVDLQLLFEQEEGSFLLLPATPMGAMDLLELNNHANYTFVPMDGVHSQFLFDIHSQSKEKEAASELLRYLLSYYKEMGKEDQSLTQFGFLPGFPIYKPILSARFADYIFYEEAESSTLTADVQLSNSTDDAMQLLNEFHTPGYRADAITDSIYSLFQERSLGYLTGEQSLEDASENVYNGLTLIYSERQ